MHIQYMKTHRHACTCSHTIIYTCRCTLVYAHTEGPQCSGHLKYWTQTQACTLYLHENGLQQSAAPLVCFVPPAVWAWGRELLVRWGGDHIRWAPMFMEPNAVKRGKKREGRGCLPGSHRNSRDSHISWKWSMVWSPSLTGEQREDKDQAKGLPVCEWAHSRSVLKGELISLT